LKEKKERVLKTRRYNRRKRARLTTGSGQVPPASMGCAGPGAAEVRVDKAGIDRTAG